VGQSRKCATGTDRGRRGRFPSSSLSYFPFNKGRQGTPFPPLYLLKGRSVKGNAHHQESLVECHSYGQPLVVELGVARLRRPRFVWHAPVRAE